MLRPNIVGPQGLYLNPAMTQLTSANIAATDETYNMDILNPYAYSAVVSDNYDAHNFFLADAGSSFVNGTQWACGLFLTPQNEKKNMVFQVSGSFSFASAIVDQSQVLGVRYFFGRAASNTVVSDLTGVQNPLAKYMYLPMNSQTSGYQQALVAAGYVVQGSIESQVFTLELVGGFNYCFGMVVYYSGATQIWRGGCSLAVRKYGTELGVFTPSR